MEKPEGGRERKRETDRYTEGALLRFFFFFFSSSSAFWLQDIQLKHTHHLKAPPAPQCGDPDRSRSLSLNSSPSLSPRVFLTRAPPRPLSKLHWLLWYRTVFLAASLPLSFSFTCSLSPSLSLSILSHNIVKEQRAPAGTCSLSERKDREALEGVREERGGGRRGRKRRYSERETLLSFYHHYSSCWHLVAFGQIWTQWYICCLHHKSFWTSLNLFSSAFFSDETAARLDIERLSSSANLSQTTGFFFFFLKCLNVLTGKFSNY